MPLAGTRPAQRRLEAVSSALCGGSGEVGRVVAMGDHRYVLEQGADSPTFPSAESVGVRPTSDPITAAEQLRTLGFALLDRIIPPEDVPALRESAGGTLPPPHPHPPARAVQPGPHLDPKFSPDVAAGQSGRRWSMTGRHRPRPGTWAAS